MQLVDNLFDVDNIFCSDFSFRQCRSRNPKIIPAIIGAVGTLAATAYSAWQQKKMNDQNTAAAGNLNKENRDWQSAENEKTREMERNALSIRTQDAMNAGFSPLAALDTGAAQVSSPTSPESFLAPGQASQMDLSSLASLGSALENDDTQKKIAKLQSDTSLASTKYQSDTSEAIAILQTQSAEKIANANIASAEAMADDRNKLEWIKMNQAYSLGMGQIQAQMNQLETNVNKDAYLEQVRQDNLTIDGVKDMARNMGFRVHFQRVDISTEKGKAYFNKLMSGFTSDVNRGVKNMSAWYKTASPEERSAMFSRNSGSNKSKNYAGGLNLNLPNKITKAFSYGAPQSGVAGTIGVGAEGSYGTTDGSSEGFAQQQMSQVQAIKAASWFSPGGQALIYPVPTRGYKSGGKDINFYQTPKSWK